MRQLVGDKLLKKIRKETGLPIHHILVRGNTNHRKDLCLKGGTIKFLWPDGSITEDNEYPPWRWS